MARYATYIRASTDTQEIAHQRTAINGWLEAEIDDLTEFSPGSAFADGVE